MIEMIKVQGVLIYIKMPRCVVYTFAGSCIWSVGTIVAGYYFGEAMGFTSDFQSVP